ncbi:DUF1549 and DUF1553 domain-containing protein [Singulisphaera sp. Ch08]|uniref:DUF1549 and DUF1553 domain-containing protein n=1 Tax=Singulisphaera sp. Ch08 TaxID=3120278 RepID=A0AAU7CRV0_9BACT
MNDRYAKQLSAALVLVALTTSASYGELVRPVKDRFAVPEVEEVPDFQRHILPLMGRLGCNARACHGSFQGQGGFRLSLFGYDFKMDHDALLKEGSARVDRDDPEASKIIQKPTLAIPHKGGKRMDEESWQYRMLVRWIDQGAKGVTNPAHFERLDVTPTEVVFAREGEQVPLKVVAHWSDGSQEDVTCISRFRTNDESIAEVDQDGLITSKGKGDTHIVAFYDNGLAVTQILSPVSEQVGPKYPDVPTSTKVDELVVNKLRKLGVVPAELCSDSEFLRRVSIDMTGTMPAPDEVNAFLADASPKKREQKVDELLSRPTYAAWWTNKLCDITGNSPRALQMQVNTDQPSRFWYEWIYRRVEENTPYDQLIAGIVTASSRKPGQSYEEFIKEESSYFRAEDPPAYSERETMPYFWARRNMRQPEEKALGFSYSFLGVRLECAQCHKHPFDQWTQDDFKQFTEFFRPIRYAVGPEKESREVVKKLTEELGLAKTTNGGERRRILEKQMKKGNPIPWQEVFVTKGNRNAGRRGQENAPKNGGGRVATPKLLGGDEVSLASVKDPREPLMEWMRNKENPYFARAFVNRVWANYFGKGIINPPDDMNMANPASNEALLDYLAKGFLSHNFDMKWLHREIALSDTYQRSWKTNETNRLDERNFSRAMVRRLPAEVLIDAVTQSTASSTDLIKLASAGTDRAIGSKGSGSYRPGNNQYAGKVFGRSTRDTNCDCNRSDEPNLLQSIYLQNDQEVLASIVRPKGWLGEVLRPARKEDKDKATPIDSEKMIREAYLRTLGRNPAENEVAIALDHLKQVKNEGDGLRDLLWALLNTKEFITNH